MSDANAVSKNGLPAWFNRRVYETNTADDDYSDYTKDFCEPWIEAKLRRRLIEYKAKYPAFKLNRLIASLSQRNLTEKMQRRLPYITDKEIKSLNKLTKYSKIRRIK